MNNFEEKDIEYFVFKAKANKENWTNGTTRIISWKPEMAKTCPIKLSKWGTFSTIGEDNYIQIGREYTVKVSVKEVNQYGSTCNLITTIDEPIDFEHLTKKDKRNILSMVSKNDGDTQLIENIIEGCPNFIELALANRDDEIDITNIRLMGDYRKKIYCEGVRASAEYLPVKFALMDWGITDRDAGAIVRANLSVEQVRYELETNPYHFFIDMLHYKFGIIDEYLCVEHPEWKATKERCEYFLYNIIRQKELEGSTRINGNWLYCYIRDNYNAPELLPFVVPAVKESDIMYYDDESKDISTVKTHDEELELRNWVNDRINNGNQLDVDTSKYKTFNGITLTENQSRIIDLFCRYNIAIISGSAGTGKSASMMAIVRLCKDLDLNFTLLAPTGKASLRLSETTGEMASTIHRATACGESKIETDVVIVDECSMLDLDTFIMLKRALDGNENLRVLLVGDTAQLMPVGKGNVFNDLVHSNKVPMVFLDEVFRYKSNGALYVATNIRKGNADFLKDDSIVKHEGNVYTIGDNYKFIETSNTDLFNMVTETYISLLDKGYKKSDILVLSSMNVRQKGTLAINNALQFMINKDNGLSMERRNKESSIKFKKGDMVIHIKNNYGMCSYDSYLAHVKDNYTNLNEIMCSKSEDPDFYRTVFNTKAFNGQIGEVIEIAKNSLGDPYMVVKYGDRPTDIIVYEEYGLSELLLAYCITCHKSQGSEAKVVINVVTTEHYNMHTRNLSYVADTRAKELTIDIGQTQALIHSLGIDGEELRNTWLRDLLKDIETTR